jgi:hypothetical protein
MKAAIGNPGETDWYDAKKVDPELPGWYIIEASNVSKKIEMLFWTGYRWLYKEGGKVAVDLKIATYAKWKGATKPPGVTFQKEKRKKTKLGYRFST